jgi:voltage-gated potassium channel
MPIYRVLEPREGRNQLNEWRRRALHTVGLFLFVVTGCTVGLLLLDGSTQSLQGRGLKAVWNALNLITTLGDFTALDGHQKVFMITTMVAFLGVGGYALSQLTGVLSSTDVLLIRENRAMSQQLDRLSGHVVVNGYAPLGRLVAGRLRQAGEVVLILDRSEDFAARASEDGYPVVQGDAGSEDMVLERARVDSAKALVITIEDQDRKLAITLMAHALNPKLTIAGTGQNTQRGELLRRAGASEVVIAEELIATELVRRLGHSAGS